MNPQTILLALTIIEFAANKAVALAEYKAIVEVARAEGRDVSDEELKAMVVALLSYGGLDALTDPRDTRRQSQTVRH
jgi:hypothetical protein